ncbi:unnamed protein product [Calypogeia fissa]
MGEQNGARKVLVQIPSAEEVERQSASRTQSLNLFRPSSTSSTGASSSSSAGQSRSSQAGQGQGQQASTFTEAFSFLRNTEFYSPPPAARPAPPPRPTAPAALPIPSSTTTSQQGGRGGPALSSVPGNFRKEEVYAAAPPTGQARNAILVSRRQQGNSVLKHIRNARWMFTDIVPDYILGQNTCALYLSLRYHLLHPEYIYFRIRELQKSFRLRVVLCHVDVDDVIKPLHEVTKTCLLHDCSLLCAWSQEECARYLETIKIYENKPADYIQERTDNDYLSRLTNSLTTVRHVNKTDVLTLGSTFKTLSAIMNASMDDLAKCPGIGERKVKRLYDAFNEPFRRVPTAKRPQQSSGDKAASGANESQARPTEGEAPAEGNSVGESSAQTKEAIPVSKLLNREDETSVREA